MKIFKIVLAAIVLAMSVGAASSFADKGGMMEDNHMMGADKAKLAIEGYCPVCITKGKFMKGNSNFTTEYKGKLYLFPGIEQQKMFVNDPQAYLSDLDSKYNVLKKASKGMKDTMKDSKMMEDKMMKDGGKMMKEGNKMMEGSHK